MAAPALNRRIDVRRSSPGRGEHAPGDGPPTARRNYGDAMAAVVLRGPASSAPERIVGPFDTLQEADDRARNHPRDGGYCVAEALTAPDDPELGPFA